MERFREHEKEFKMKQYSKKALQNMNNPGTYGSDSDGGSNYGEEQASDDDGEGDDDDEPISTGE